MLSSEILSIIISIAALDAIEAIMSVNSMTEANAINQGSLFILSENSSYDPDHEAMTSNSTYHSIPQVVSGGADTSRSRFITTFDLQYNMLLAIK